MSTVTASNNSLQHYAARKVLTFTASNNSLQQYVARKVLTFTATKNSLQLCVAQKVLTFTATNSSPQLCVAQKVLTFTATNSSLQLFVARKALKKITAKNNLLSSAVCCWGNVKHSQLQTPLHPCVAQKGLNNAKREWSGNRWPHCTGASTNTMAS